MARHLRGSGSIIVTALAICAVTASVAKADVLKTDAGLSVNLSGQQALSSILKTTAGSAECFTVTYAGTLTNGSSSVLVTPTFNSFSCTCIGVACTVETNGCVFRLNIGFLTFGTVDLVCPEKKELTFTSSKCTIHIGSQTNFGSLSFVNVGSGSTKELNVFLNSTEKLKYRHTEGTGIGRCKTGESTTGSLSGSFYLTGVIDGGTAHVGTYAE